MPNGRLFMSERGLLPFQAEAVAHAYLRKNLIGVIDRGLGKSVIFMALAAKLIEDGLVDVVVSVSQANKLSDRKADREFPWAWKHFTSLHVHKHLGTGRMERLAKAQASAPVDVVLTSYETGKLDLMTRVKKGATRGKGGRADGPLMEALGLRDKRVLWIFDEIIKLSHRNNELYQAYDYAVNQLRRGPHEQRVFALSANPFTSEWVESENIALIVDPDKVPPITKFKELFTYGTDDQGGLRYRKEARTVFVPMFQELIYRKRSSDPDVAGVIPRLEEMPLIHVTLDPAHRKLYSAVQKVLGPWDDLTENQRGTLTQLLAIVAGHPRALARAESDLAKSIVAAVGEQTLAAIPSSKTLQLIRELQTLRGQQVLIFTWWAETVLPELVIDLEAAGALVGTYTGPDARSVANKQAFREGRLDILVSSDAGARGLDLPEAQRIFEYESARSFETRMQRFGRGTRITSEAKAVFGYTLVADQTVEAGTVRRMMQRNADQDHLLVVTDAEGYFTAADRKLALRGSR